MIGAKVGCTPTAVRSLLGIDSCVTGRLDGLEQYTPVAALHRVDSRILRSSVNWPSSSQRSLASKNFLPGGPDN